MPGTSITEVRCQKCGHVFEAQVIDHIDMSQDRDLLKRIKSGKINRVQCPKCKKVHYLERGVVINFEPENLIVLYDPSASRPEVREELMRDYRSVVMFNEVLEEVAQETEFKIVSDTAELKKIVEQWAKAHSEKRSVLRLPLS